jgi:hypothetical protein
MRDVREPPPGLIQSHVFPDQVSVRDFDALDEFFFTPTIQPVTDARFPLRARNELLSLSVEEVLGLRVSYTERDG